MLRRTWAEIDLDSLEHNAALIRERLEPGCRMLGIVKADAYGHGAVPVARTLAAAGADWFGVSNLDEAVQLRLAGLEQPILVISYTPPAEVRRLADYRVTQAVVSREHAAGLSRAAAEAGVTVRVHIKVDTGMTRVGFVCHDPASAPETAQDIVAACRLPGLQAEGIFTHFATADGPDDTFTRHQFACFTAVIDEAGKQGVTFAIRHCCNSAATLRHPEMHLDMVRPGIILYGLWPDEGMAGEMTDFRPVMQLKTAVSLVKDIPAGTPLSYGCTHVTDAPTRVATVPIGYADGYFRLGSNRQFMLIKGQKAPVLGRVCMDQCMLDVTAIPDVREGDEVTVFGTDTGAFLSADEVAKTVETVGYELVCGITRRVSRSYRRSGNVVLITDLLDASR